MQNIHQKRTKHLIVVGGPTASGKTETAIRIAEHFKTEILSADSRQFYREMTIGTAKPTQAELGRVKHHFINSLSVGEEYSVGNFEKDAIALLEMLFETHDHVVVAGGSGLFINALCYGLDEFPEVTTAIKEQVAQIEKTNGVVGLQRELARLDPVYFTKVDQSNPARMRRALEVCLGSRLPYSSFLGASKPPRPFQIHQFMCDWPRAELYQRIEQRVDGMIAAGLEAEARGLLPYRYLPALKTVGYEEWFTHFDGQLSYDQTIDKIKQHTRNYAKRQLTWFRKYGNWIPIVPKNFEKINQYFEKI